MFEIQTSKASRTLGVLFALTGVLGILILAFDKVLAESVPAHLYALVVFVIIDFIVAAAVLRSHLGQYSRPLQAGAYSESSCKSEMSPKRTNRESR